jgi:hypothetical protein
MGPPALLALPKEGVLRTFIALKNPSPRPSLNPRTLGPVTSTLTTTPPRWLSRSRSLLSCMELEYLLPCPQESATSRYPECDEPSRRRHIPLKILIVKFDRTRSFLISRCRINYNIKINLDEMVCKDVYIVSIISLRLVSFCGHL